MIPQAALAQQQFQGLCARVKIEILQELTIERIGFEATLEITNNDGQDPITDFFANLTFEDPLKSTNGVADDASSMFFVRAPTLENIEDVGGSGIIGPTKKATMRWFIIPKISAGGTTPNGRRYRVGAQLSARFQGIQIPADVLQVFPDNIYVRPEAQLEITYFQPRDVQGDDPFTTEIVESPIPFTLGVLVKNSGFGIARSVKINSQQPKIVENRRNLLLVAQLLGTRVMDAPLQRADLLVNIGDLNPGETRKGAWDMITSLSGEFTEFKASYTHASELGGQETSVIKSIAAHFIAHEVINDQPGRDRIKDFLADTDRDPDLIPDALYESEGNILPVNYLAIASVASTSNPFQVQLTADRAGWGYLRVDDPGQARLRIQSVVRSDGKVLNLNNAWTNLRYERGSNNRLNYLNLLDLVELGDYTYTITYAPAGNDTTPPVTTLNFAGVVTATEGKFIVTPETQMFFLSEDESPVSIVYSVTNGPFRPALPFRLRTPGEYPIRYYATDSSQNQEGTNSAIVVVYDDAPSLANMGLTGQNFFAAGDALSIRPSEAVVTFQAQPNPTRVNATIDIFRGVVAWANIRGVPSSPTSDSGASLQVGGDNVDFYRFRVDGGPWSAEQPVSTPLAVAGLLAGTHTVAILGRSRYGDYLPDEKAVEVSWTVNSAAPPTRITGTPAAPTANRAADLTVAGAGVTDYRWTINNGFYRPETAVSTPLTLSALTGTQQVVAVIGKVGGVLQPTNNPTTVRWTIDPGYGSDFSSLPQVRSVTATNIGATPYSFGWDGRGDDGAWQSPGWYLVRITLRDQLGRFSFSTRLVSIAELSGATAVVAQAATGPSQPHAHGRWAVWQAQGSGNSEIMALDLAPAAATPIPVTAAGRNQENPKTDGRYVVWQSRQSNGNWDIHWRDLVAHDAPQILTATSDRDEINPSIDWPWIVYQSRPAAATGVPWQLRAHNLVNAQAFDVDPSTQDQLDPAVQAGRVVWQDHRDVGFGEIYFKDLELGDRRRLTTNSFGQYLPVISDHWIVWQDNRNGEVDLYGFDLHRNTEIQITATPENEARPYLDGPWLLCEEDSLGSLTANLRIIHLSSLRAVPLTRTSSFKTRPALASGSVIWQEGTAAGGPIVRATLPSFQAVFANQNAVPVTPTLPAYHADAFALLAHWNAQAGVQEITTYTALVPEIRSLTARWVDGAPAGDNFPIVPGSFLWVKFGDHRVLDLGVNPSGPFNLVPGINVVSSTAFPSQFTAFRLVRQLGPANVRGVRMFDAEGGRWLVALVRDGQVAGQDFKIPNAAVLFIDSVAAVDGYQPE